MKIASIVDDLVLSQSSFYMIKNFNILGQDLNNQPFCFFHNLSSVPVPPLFSIMNAYYASYFYGGVLLATNLKTLKTVVNLSSNAKKYFYVNDLEWLREEKDFMDNVSMMNNPKIKLIARSESHAKAIKNYCNVSPVAIIENWNYKELLKL